MDGDKTYTLKEAKDLLRHIKEQKLNYCGFPSHQDDGSAGIRSISDPSDLSSREDAAEDSAWQFYEELPSRSKFLMLFHILNEKHFKSTVFDLLMLIKVSHYPLMNASFLCLGNHLEHVYDLSSSNLSDEINDDSKQYVRTSSITKLTAGTGLNGNRMIELDAHFTWHPEASEFLLSHITVPSSCGGIDHFPVHLSNLQIIPSSRVLLYL
jgi:hypothetical protein